MTSINQTLLNRAIIVSSEFFEQWKLVPFYQFPTTPKFQQPALNNPHKNDSKNLKDLTKTDGSDSGTNEGSSDGGGTMKGLRIETPRRLTR